MAARALGTTTSGTTVLVVGDPRDDVVDVLAREDVHVQRWDRRVQPGRAAAAQPPAGPFDLSAVRLPRAKEELAMTLHMVAGVMRPAGGLLLFGANDEGIKSAASRLSPMFGGARRAATGGHCRAIFATRAPQPGPLRDTLDQWQSTLDPQLEGLSDTWVTFPGVFAHGSLDPGTALLIGALPKDLSGQHVLDYGAGTGIIGGVCGGRGATVDLLDVDTVALAAARINVPSATLFAADNLSAVPSNYDAIVSNPPIHRGKAETHDVLEALIRDAPDHLNENGALYLVVQRRVPIETALGAAFGSVERVADDAVFKVLRARDR